MTISSTAIAGLGADMAGAPKSAKEAAPRAWQRMLSGRRLDLLDPSPLDIEIDDIAHGLSRVARWNGQTIGPHIFSVAQHSLLVERIAAQMEPGIGRETRLFMLLHDAPEYVIGDMISPFKAVIGDAYKSVENRILSAILLRYSLPPVPAPATLKLAKDADRAAAFFEAVALAGFTRREAERIFGRPAISPQALAEEIAPAAVDVTQARFLSRFHAIDRG
jgi:5'-deoxynucleotidase YfbR-like HD superfamily hydrolase